jgi:CxxC motif-containing protein (DUF1111 family)
MAIGKNSFVGIQDLTMRGRTLKRTLLNCAGSLVMVLLLAGCAKTKDANAPEATADSAGTLKVSTIAVPVPGLTAEQLRKFRDTEKVFKQEFTPEQGLGPLFNDRSCFACHGQQSGPVGGEGRDVTTTGVIRIGRLRKESPFYGKPVKDWIANTTDKDVYNYIFEGGPALERRSITQEFSNKYPAEASCEIGLVPKDCGFQSLRHAMPLLGLGLLDGIDDKELTNNIFKEVEVDPAMAGRAIAHDDPLTKTFRIGRFGWKDQQPNLLLFSAEAMDVEMGLTTPVMHHPKSAKGVSDFPHAIVGYLPKEPNDEGKIMAQLAYFQALLAPPDRGPITEQAKRGEKVFEMAQCSVCHMPTMFTKPEVFVVDPDSPAPKFNLIQVAALENKPVHAYSDLLVHNMGWELADGLPQNGARGGEWRTTPLWGLRNKRFLIHDGRTQSLEEAIMLHGGQGSSSRDKFKKLNTQDKEDLIAFLRSL